MALEKSLNTSSPEDKPKARKCKTCPTMIEPVFMVRSWIQPDICGSCADKEVAKHQLKTKVEGHKQAMRLLALQPRFQNASFKEFKKDLQPLAYRIAGEFAKEYEPKKTEKGLYFYGEPGSGKTHLMAAIANYLIHKESVRFITSPELLLSIRKSFGNTTIEEGLLDQLSKINLLIIDDIGSEKPSEWVQETLFVLIDRRYTNFKPTLFTSNYSLDDLKERLGYRTASRIAEMTQVVELQANDYRIRKK